MSSWVCLNAQLAMLKHFLHLTLRCQLPQRPQQSRTSLETRGWCGWQGQWHAPQALQDYGFDAIFAPIWENETRQEFEPHYWFSQDDH